MTSVARFFFVWCWSFAAALFCGCESPKAPAQPPPIPPAQPAAPENVGKPTHPDAVPVPAPAVTNDGNRKILSLFDGESLAGWEPTNFGGEGECRVEAGKLIIEPGYPMSGVTSTRSDLPKSNYEISLEVQRTTGIDFFCGLTFPVNDSHCSLILGGWAGTVVGLSNIDDQDASRNETRKLMRFEKHRWYKVKVRVEPQRIQAWIDEEQVVDQDITGRKISLRNETLPSRPLGICNFETTSEFKNIELIEMPND